MKIKSVLLIFFLLIFRSLIYSDTLKKIKIVTAQKTYEGIDLLLKEGMGYIKVKDIADVFGGRLKFEKNKKRVTLTINNKNIYLFINEKAVVIEGIKRLLKKKTFIAEGKLWLPLELIITKAFSNVVGIPISWDYANLTITAIKGINITSIRSYSYSDYSRVVVESTHRLVYHLKRTGDIIILELLSAKANLKKFPLIINDGAIKKITAVSSNETITFKFYLDKGATNHRIFRLVFPERIIVDINKKERKRVPKPSVSKIKEYIPPLTKEPKIKIKTVVIDPGHGGKDPGAVGRRGTKEKDITLAISKKLAYFLKEHLNLEVILTRNKDIFIPLRERTRIANKYRADLFVSIHINASLKPVKHGFEVYFLSDEVSDREAQIVANKENEALKYEKTKEEINNELSAILWSLTLNEYMNESSELCSFISEEVKKDPFLKKMENRGIKEAGFYVLRGAKMPAVLVEAGFITNPEEERKLKKSWFQKRIAMAIYNGIKRYKNWIER